MFDLTASGLEVLGEPQRWNVHANWKIPADNFGGDPYHVSTAHGSLTAMGLLPSRDVDATRIVAVSDPEHGHCLECTVLPDRGETDEQLVARACRMHGVPENGAKELRSRLTPEQLDSLVRHPVSVGTLFPNFSFLRAPLRSVVDGPYAPAFTIRVWRPVAADRTEVWSWALAHRDAPDELKERMATTVVRTFGSSGMAEQDDTEIWTGMQQSFAGVQGRQRWLRFRPHFESDPAWTTPGVARFGPQGEHRQWNFYRRWHEMLCS
jgi:phenylpropionate dioxygenase-like ring-hydroxylating dioxygenase large terminal subunit